MSLEKNASSSGGKRPAWVGDEGRLAMFPEAQYVSVLAWGVSADDAKSKAATELSNYVQSSIASQIGSSLKTTQQDSYTASEYQRIRHYQMDTSISSATTLYQIQYAAPWLDKSQGEYFCCAYIRRAAAWSYIEPTMQKSRDNFTKQYEAALLEKDNFSKMAAVKRAQVLLADFYRYYDFATFIDPAKASAYKALDNLAVESYERLASLRLDTKINIIVENDNSKRAHTKLSSLFERAGFIVTNSASDYTARAQVIYDTEAADDVYTAYPEFNLNLDYSGNTLASYNKHLPKVAMYDETNVVRRIFHNLETELERSFIKECLEN